MKLIPESAIRERLRTRGFGSGWIPNVRQSRTIVAFPAAGCFGVSFSFTRALA